MVHNQFYQTYQQVNIQKLLDGRTRLEQQLIQTWTHEMKSIPDIDKVLEFEINTHDARGTVYIAKLENSQLKLSKGVCLGRDLSHGKFGIYDDSNEVVSLSWCESCTHPRPGGFGGGVILISRKEIRYQPETEWVRQNIKEMKEAL